MLENKYIKKYLKRERRGNAPDTQKTVDNSYSSRYNENSRTTTYDVGDYTKKNEPDTTKRFGFAPEINSWAKKNSDAIKYAGDGAINSIKKAAKDYLNKYLKDAPEETDKDELFDSIAKWQLARDANDEKRGNVAMNNVIGHMSTENKDHYLKEQIPFSEYVTAKDDFDYKTGKYTTTEYASKAADKAVKNIQQKLNEKGYTDKYGNSIKEDGLVGSKTLQAYDSLEKDLKKEDETKSTDNKYNVDISKIKKLGSGEYQYGDLLITNNGTSFASAGGPMPLEDMDMDTVVKAIQDYRDPASVTNVYGPTLEPDLPLPNLYKPEKIEAPYYSDLVYKPKPGNLSHGDEKYSEATKTIIKTLSKNWYRNADNLEVQGTMHTQAENVRQFDDDSFEKAVFLNDSDGARIFGHTGVMLINKAGCSIVFSVFSDEQGLPVDNKAEMRFAVLTAEETENVLKKTGNIENMASSDGQKKNEDYDRFATFEITNENGYKMYEFASSLFSRPGDYKLFSRQCDDIACEILSKGGINIKSKPFPNWTYISIDGANKSRNERK